MSLNNTSINIPDQLDRMLVDAVDQNMEISILSGPMDESGTRVSWKNEYFVRNIVIDSIKQEIVDLIQNNANNFYKLFLRTRDRCSEHIVYVPWEL